MNEPLTREQWLTYLDTIWKQCLADAWQKEWDDMNREEIIRMAREAELNVGPAGMGQTVWGSDTNLKRFASLVAAAEREAVCRIVTGLCISDNNSEEINRAIRARGQV
jgi:hypothetical protein